MMGKDRDLDDAERALGTLPRKGESPRARRAREAWEMRLAALLRPVEPVKPPAGMFARISERLSHVEVHQALRRSKASARRWKGIASVAGLAAVGMCAALLTPILSPPALSPSDTAAQYVAIVTSDETGQPGMVVEFDTRTGFVTVIPLETDAPQDRAFQMWHLPTGATAPASIGLLPDSPTVLRDIRAGSGDTFAISVEQPGGSPTGQPTDARYHGQAVRAD